MLGLVPYIPYRVHQQDFKVCSAGTNGALDFATVPILCFVFLRADVWDFILNIELFLDEEHDVGQAIHLTYLCCCVAVGTLADIKLAIHTFTSRDFENLSDSTLEAILDVVYYPKHLCRLVNPRLTSAMFDLLMLYPEGHPALGFSLGCLVFQCVALATAVSLLAESGKLDQFIEDVGPSARQDRTDVSPLMNTWLMDMFNEDVSSANDMLINLKTRLGWTLVGGKPACLLTIGGHNLTSTMELLVNCFLERDGVLQAYTSMPFLGWPVLLVVMWVHLKSLTLDNKLLHMARLRDIVLRYCLVSAPNEHFVMQALMDDFTKVLPQKERHPPPLNKPYVMGHDAGNIYNALVQQLSFRQSESTSARLKYLTYLTDYGLQVLDNSGFSNLLSILEIAFDRLWHELTQTSESLGEDLLGHVISFAATLFQAIVKCFTQTDHIKQLTSGSISLVPDLISTLARIDIVGVLGRLLLLPLAAISPKTISTSTSARMVKEILHIVSQLTHSLSKYRRITRSAFSEGYIDWLKTLNYMTQLRDWEFDDAPHSDICGVDE
ncbi:hypothetical protein BDV93DRAFT_565096 [Ceratobasidium sp. AG-I]|nr:hypothetical protein BDV93DRAFT_565096 [Ceratobasidium sp. AG-I]